MSAFRCVDFHCHILPKADHGSDSAKTSVTQVRNAIAAGIDCVIATPHFYPGQDDVSSFLERREGCFDRLRRAMKEEDLHLDLQLGGEIAMSKALPEMEGLERLCIGNSRYLLLEMPAMFWTQWDYDAIYFIESVRRLTPVIAHVDRYKTAQVQQLFDMSLLTQVNAESFVRLSRRRQMRQWVEDGLIHFLGSDTHGTGEHSFSAFSKAVRLWRETDPSFMDRSVRLLEEARGGEDR